MQQAERNYIAGSNFPELDYNEERQCVRRTEPRRNRSFESEHKGTSARERFAERNK